MAAAITIRTAALPDAERLLEIYRPYVEETAITFEYDVPTIDEFRGRMTRVLEKYPYLVAERDGTIVGYAYAGPFVGRAAYYWSVETTIYLDRAVRRQGIGKALYTALETVLGAMGILNLNACIGYPEVEDEHLTRNSVEFHAHLGYQWVGQFHNCGYKFGRWYHMVWMEKMLGEHPLQPDPVDPFSSVRAALADRHVLTK